MNAKLDSKIAAAVDAISAIAMAEGRAAVVHLCTIARAAIETGSPDNAATAAIARLEALVNLAEHGNEFAQNEWDPSSLVTLGASIQRNGTHSRGHAHRLAGAMDGFDCALLDGAVAKGISGV